jgi:hypothetical protein
LLQELLARLLICHRPSEAENRLQFLPAAKLARFAAANTIVEARLGRLRLVCRWLLSICFDQIGCND